MILIPDKNVLLVLKEGNIPVEDIRLRIMTDKDYRGYEISFKDRWYSFRKGLKIPETYHGERFLQLKLRCVDRNGNKLEFVSERMPLIVYTMIGDRIEDLYPVAIQKVMDMEESIMKKILNLEEELKELKSLGELGEL